MEMLIGWICIYTAFVFGGSVWFGADTSVKAGVLFFITLEIVLTLFTIGTYLMAGGK